MNIILGKLYFNKAHLKKWQEGGDFSINMIKIKSLPYVNDHINP